MKKLLSLLIVFFLVSCDTNELKVDVSDVEIEAPEFKALHRDLFALREENFGELSAQIESTYGPVFQKYLMNPLRIPGSSDSNYKALVLAFLKDRDISKAHQDILKVFGDEQLLDLQASFMDCIKHFKYHFPKRNYPRQVVFCQTGWNYAFAYVDQSFLIGLDMYLGEDSEFYKMLSYPQYQVRKMKPEYLLPDAARGWILTEFDQAGTENHLLQSCVFYGKLFYAVNALLPDTHDSLIIGYTGKQLKYCQQYEKNLWGYFAAKNRLYDSNLELVRELTSDGPFTGSISKECPPRIAMWVGWQIVRSYMKNNRELSLQDLMNETDAKKILNKSRYRP